MKRKFGTIALLVALFLSVYAFAFWNSLREVDAFCNSIGPTTKMSDLQMLAQRAGVDLRGPMEMTNSSGKEMYAIAASGFTVGEYACSIHGDSLTTTVIRKHLGYFGSTRQTSVSENFKR